MAKFVDRLLLFLYSLSIGITSVIAILLLSGVIPPQLDNLDGRKLWMTALIVAIVLLLLSVRFIYVSFRRNRTSMPTIDQRTDYGDIQISVETIESLCLKAASKSRGVSDLKSRVKVTESGLDITIRAVVEGDMSIPVLTSDIQKAVHDHLEEITGIPVANVSVYIANVTPSAAFKSRVE
ncbi:alkaline shock response membrane anchor protein AmaP [Paenibacillus sp. P96]|uniref:Alkaline shock response membrane anchor protein AmaP n=1 Tax=Paenibacillus zeirhizosphaerae TaxID=2987519 RepID=A0ABT9FPU8_9BACL|nr:alkaline shock response membrane anchor protein AmaP [Paenibacillus sp. P96]MDP4096739.1 alkaline shock response membrane anchor protein AmaP [Paenibacillus sp. P96]